MQREGATHVDLSADGPGAVVVLGGQHPDRRPDPVSGRHLGLEFNLSVPDVVAELGGESGALDGRDDDTLGRVGGDDAVGSSFVGGRARSVGRQVERPAVEEVLTSDDILSQGGNDVERVVGNEGVGVRVGGPLKLAVPIERRGCGGHVSSLLDLVDSQGTHSKPPNSTCLCQVLVSRVSKLSSTTRQSFPGLGTRRYPSQQTSREQADQFQILDNESGKAEERTKSSESQTKDERPDDDPSSPSLSGIGLLEPGLVDLALEPRAHEGLSVRLRLGRHERPLAERPSGPHRLGVVAVLSSGVRHGRHARHARHVRPCERAYDGRCPVCDDGRSTGRHRVGVSARVGEGLASSLGVVRSRGGEVVVRRVVFTTLVKVLLVLLQLQLLHMVLERRRGPVVSLARGSSKAAARLLLLLRLDGVLGVVARRGDGEGWVVAVLIVERVETRLTEDVVRHRCRSWEGGKGRVERGGSVRCGS